jgi:hypothetical protein
MMSNKWEQYIIFPSKVVVVAAAGNNPEAPPLITPGEYAPCDHRWRPER